MFFTQNKKKGGRKMDACMSVTERERGKKENEEREEK